MLKKRTRPYFSTLMIMIRDQKSKARLIRRFIFLTDQIARSDYDISEQTLKRMKELAVQLNNKEIIRKILIQMLFRDHSRKNKKSIFIENNIIMKDYKSLPCSIRYIYGEAISCFALAVSYNNIVLGRLARRLFLYNLNYREISSRCPGAMGTAAELCELADIRAEPEPPSGTRLTVVQIAERAA